MAREELLEMLTEERLAELMAESERLEQAHYEAATRQIYLAGQQRLFQLYDELDHATNGLTAIDGSILAKHPEVIQMLRYTTIPSVSQMRLGQIAGVRSTKPFEEGQVPSGAVAQAIAEWINPRLDPERFPPALRRANEPAEAREQREKYARLWTVSLISGNRTDTDYRNKRKALQENKVAAALEAAGLVSQRQLGPDRARRPRGAGKAPPRPTFISSIEDVVEGRFVREKKVGVPGQTKQKADLTARPVGRGSLFCIEAKAVGIRLDSAKRLKEVGDKASDWGREDAPPIVPCAVIAGFFTINELKALMKGRGIPVFWEHDLGELQTFLKSGEYYGSPWKPAELFKEMPPQEVEATLQEIEAAASEDAIEEGDVFQ